MPNFSDDLGAALLALVILAFFVERALAPIFDWKAISQDLSDRKLKVPIAVLVSIVLCFVLEFDVVKPLGFLIGGAPNPGNPYFNIVLTGLIVSGGSAGALKLMQDVLGITKENRDLTKRLQEARQNANIALANKDIALASAAQQRAKAEITVAENLIRTSSLELAEREAVAGARLLPTVLRAGGAEAGAQNLGLLARARAMAPVLKARADLAVERGRLIRATGPEV